MEDSTTWKGPMTPMELVRKRFLKNLAEPAAFAEEYELDPTMVEEVFSGKRMDFPPALCTAFSVETHALSEDGGMTPEFFKNLSEQHQRQTAGAA